METKKEIRHIVIPDVQVRHDVDYSHLKWVGRYIAEKRPDVVVCLGDFADMPSLSKYDIGKKSAEGKRYVNDINSANDAISMLTAPIKEIRSDVRPRLVMTLGNHEQRIITEIENNPRFDGLVTDAQLDYTKHGWEVFPFLKVAKINQIEYAHYFISGVLCKPVTSATALLKRRHSSAIMGHVQKIDIAVHPQTQQIGIFAGICYQHEEDYLGPQGNSTKRGIWVLNEIHDGTFDPMFVSLGFLKRKYS